MIKIIQLFTSLLPWTASRLGSRMRPRKWILGLSVVAALLSWGCPKQDPLQAFDPPPSPTSPPPAPVPEPVTALLFGTALLIGGAIVRRRRNRNHR